MSSSLRPPAILLLGLLSLLFAQSLLAEPERGVFFERTGALDRSSPHWDRPRDTGSTISPTCAATATDSWNDGVPYASHPILVTTSGPVTVSAIGLAGFDVVVALYCEPFAAGAPLTGLVGIDDDGPGYPDAFLGTSLAPGLYWVVVSAYSNREPSGGYMLTLSGAEFTEPPRVTELRTIDGLGQPALTTGDALDRAITELQVGFDRAMLDPAGDSGADDVTNTDNYLLVEAGPDASLDTTDCATGAAPGDLQSSFSWTSWDATTKQITLGLTDPTGLSAGRYRFFACGATTLRGDNGLPLDGNGDGVGGDDDSLTFEVMTTNLIANPNFDLDLASWSGLAGVSWSMDDSEAAPVSGSLELLVDDPAPSAEQCIAVVPPGLVLRGRVRGSGAPQPEPTLSLRFWSSSDCSGTDLGGRSWMLQPSAPNWLGFERLTSLGAAASVAVSLVSGTGTNGIVGFDALSAIASPILFADDFEAANLDLWSRMVQPPP